MVSNAKPVKANAGGLKLCFMLMTNELLQMCRILYTCLRACWDWYTLHVTTVKTPKQNMSLIRRMAEGAGVDNKVPITRAALGQ